MLFRSKGHLAAQFTQSSDEAGPRVVYLDRPPELTRESGRHFYRHCGDKAVLWHGRSYMYGLPDNIVPMPAGSCD